MGFLVMLKAEREDINQGTFLARNTHPSFTVPNGIADMVHLLCLATAERTFAARSVEGGSADLMPVGSVAMGKRLFH
jgi:hypothetical protein